MNCCSVAVPLGNLGSHDETVHFWSFAGHHVGILLYPMTASLLMAVVTACWPTISLSNHIINYHWKVLFLKRKLFSFALIFFSLLSRVYWFCILINFCKYSLLWICAAFLLCLYAGVFSCWINRKIPEERIMKIKTKMLVSCLYTKNETKMWFIVK